MNVKLLRRIKRMILKHPTDFMILKHPTDFNMGWWFLNNENAACGTTACIAGWAHTLVTRTPHKKSSPAIAQKIGGSWAAYHSAVKHLQLNTKSRETDLFFSERWPEPFRNQYLSIQKDRTDRGRVEAAQIAARLIDYYIKTDGFKNL